ncbi:MAG: site-specific integrase [bacterium]|nr:site-specific integrase [bacterium]
MRRGELCALRWSKVDVDRKVLIVARSIIDLNGRELEEAPTKNRRIRRVSVDDRTLALLVEQMNMMRKRATEAEVELVADPYVFSDAVDGAAPWRPGAVTQYFTRLRKRLDLDHLNFHTLRKFMETYAQDLGFSPVQVAMRAGHDPSVAAKHYTGHVAEADQALAEAVSSLLGDIS